MFEPPASGLFTAVVVSADGLLPVIITYMTIGDAIQLAEARRPPDGVIRCLIYVRISMDKAHDGHGVANQMAKLEQKANERGWTVVYRLSDNDIGVTRKDPTKPGKYRPGYEEAMRLVDARAVDAVLCFKPKLPSLCVDISVLTCENAEDGKVFLHRKSATMTRYHDGSLCWSGHVARRHDLGTREGPGQRHR